MLNRCLVLLLALLSSLVSAAPVLQSPRALVVDAETGEVLLSKDADEVASIASLTKLMTAMVVLDAGLNPFEVLTIETADLDTIKGTKSGVPVGSQFTRRTLVRLALLSSDNRAAAALGRTYPGGNEAFVRATAAKAAALGLEKTFLEEPTGLSPNNRSSASDMARVLRAAADYPEIREITSQAAASFDVNGVDTAFKNTNKMVGSPGWSILVSKTGYTRDAGVCVSMMLEEAGRKVLVVLLGAKRGDDRALDALNIKRWLAGEPLLAQLPAARKVARASPVKQVSYRGERSRKAKRLAGGAKARGGVGPVARLEAELTQRSTHKSERPFIE
jgi:D-alanyl-D-alanine carboxypeptidase/D-alanyl-D-alanine endopeptidase (penicillin-binding protein 7)